MRIRKSVLISAFGIMLFVLLYAYLSSGMQQLPGPIYGGDVYRDRGMIVHILDFKNPFMSSFFLDHSAYYSWFPFVIIALISSMGFPIDTAYAVIYPMFQIIVAGIVYYFVSRIFFKSYHNQIFATLVMTWFTLSYHPRGLLNPLMLLSVTLMYQGIIKRNWYYFGGSGLLLGCVGMIRFSEFFVLSGIIFLYVIFYFLVYEKKKDVIWYLKSFAIFYFCAGLVVSLLLIPIAYHHQFNTLNPVYQYGERSLDSLGPSWAFSVFRNIFFNFSSLRGIVISLLTLAGVIFALFSRKKEYTIFVFFLLVPIILSQHWLITQPLFGRWFLPAKVVIQGFVVPFLVSFGAIQLLMMFKNRIRVIVTYLVLVLILSIFAYSHVISLSNDQWFQHGFSTNEQTKALYLLGEWMRENIPRNVAVLSHDETGYMITALSGRKVMVSRRTHVSYYVDIDRRIADAAVIMFGDNDVLRRQLIEYYNLEYFMEDHMLYLYPMRTVPQYSQYLADNGVVFYEVRDRLDIAVPDAHIFDLLLIPPQELSEDLRSLLEPIEGIMVNDQFTHIIHRINVATLNPVSSAVPVDVTEG